MREIPEELVYIYLIDKFSVDTTLDFLYTFLTNNDSWFNFYWVLLKYKTKNRMCTRQKQQFYLFIFNAFHAIRPLT